MHNIVTVYEELTMNAHPALKSQLYDGWSLRFSRGHTGRANSVYPIYPSMLPIDEKVEYCEHMYARERLPAVFKLTGASPAGLDAYLDARGYAVVTPTFLFTCDTLPSGQISEKVTITHSPEPSWRKSCFRLTGLINPSRRATASAMMDIIQHDTLCASIVADEKTIACGLCVIERGYAGLYDIAVDPAYRQRGYAHALCHALLGKASAAGATTAYLQVLATNTAAIELYKKLGFSCSYDYWYRAQLKH